jgi:protein TonB
MAGDLLRVGAPRSSARTRQSSLVFVSAVVHAGIITALVVTSMLLPGVLPTPHASVIWDGSRLVRLADIALPPPAPPARPRVEAPAVPTATVPLTAPDGIAPEPERVPPPSPSQLTDSVVQGVGIGDLGGTIVAPPPVPRSEPTRPVRLHSGIEPPRKVRDIVPVYPALARSAGVQGIVILEATIDERGDVVAAHVIRSIPMLDDAAVEAVRQWKYTPARLNDQPVPVVVTVTVNFTLASR